MKKAFINLLSLTAIFALSSSISLAATNNDTAKKLWICETNASSATTDADKKADEMMKTGKRGKEAFDYAKTHCRDCTKITCTLQTTNGTEGTMNSTTTTNGSSY